VHWRVVQLVVQDCSPPVFNRIFDRRNYKNDNEGNGVERGITSSENRENLQDMCGQRLAACRSRRGTYTQDDDEQKVDVGDIVELEPQILGNEAERRVLGGSYLVARVVCNGVAVFVALSLRQRRVEVDSSPTVGLVGACIRAVGRVVVWQSAFFAQRVALLSRSYPPVQPGLEALPLVLRLEPGRAVRRPSDPLLGMGRLDLLNVHHVVIRGLLRHVRGCVARRGGVGVLQSAPVAAASAGRASAQQTRPICRRGQTQVRVGSDSRRSGRGRCGVGGEGGEARRASCTRLVRILCYGTPAAAATTERCFVTNTKNGADWVGLCERLCAVCVACMGFASMC
jgi:hypothetical protein